ncbi:MAG: AraC family transcriptional regulator [Ruminococcaceae bacterium]|nr:AraC family transcriptional regulator [Oscillospiraceae bacterium]
MRNQAKAYKRFTFKDENLKIIQRINSTSFINTAEEYSSDFHEEIEIKFFFEGSSTLIIGEENIVTEPGDVIFINPYEFHTTVGFKEKKGKYHLLMVGLDFFKDENRDLLDLRYLFIKEHTTIKHLIRGNKRIAAIISQIMTELNEGDEMYEQMIRGLLLELFVLLLRDYKFTTTLNYLNDKKIRNYELIYPAIRRIRTDYLSRPSIEELSNMCGVSKYHFCRIFKKATDMTVVQYQNEFRLRIADTLLKTSDKNIREIAESCGFDDVSYFSRCYKNKFGESPLKSRSKKRNNQ